jgi:hypothetical protein
MNQNKKWLMPKTTVTITIVSQIYWIIINRIGLNYIFTNNSNPNMEIEVEARVLSLHP